MNEVITRDETGPAVAPGAQRSALPASVNAGAVTIESERAIAEARGQIQLAKMFPRDLDEAEKELMRSCSIPAFAQVAFYSKPQGKNKDTGEDNFITGESIRLAEEMARVVGNFEYGHRELSRTADKSEVEVYAWDKQLNNRSIRQITVMHWRDTKQGGYKLRDQKDVDDKIANVASKQVRGRILALMPKWLVESAKEKLRETLLNAAKGSIAERLPRIIAAFAQRNITEQKLVEYIGRPLNEITAEDIVELQGVFNALRDGANPAEYFGGEQQPANDNKPAIAQPAPGEAAKPHAATQAVKAKRTAAAAAEAPAPTPAPAPAPAPEPEPEPEPPQNDAPPVESDGDFF